MHRSGNATVDRPEVPHEPIRPSESAVRRRRELGVEVGAIRELLGDDGGLQWLVTQPARCARDAARVAMTIDTRGVFLRCPRCARVAAWRAADDKELDARLGS